MARWSSGDTLSPTLMNLRMRVDSLRTTADLGTSSTNSDGEWTWTLGASVTTLNFRSGTTTFYFASSASTDQ